MKSDTTGAVFTPQESACSTGKPAAAAFAAPDDAPDRQGAWSAALLSRLSFCIAWLFGLEAFFADPAADLHGRAPAPRR